MFKSYSHQSIGLKPRNNSVIGSKNTMISGSTNPSLVVGVD